MKAAGHLSHVDIRVTTPSRAAPGRRSPACFAAGGAEIRMCGRVGQLRATQLLRPARGPRFPKGPAAGGADMCMRRCVAAAARAWPVVPVGPTAGSAASYSAVQLGRDPRAASGSGWARDRRRLEEHAARCRSCGVADGVVHQVGRPVRPVVAPNLSKPTFLAEVDLAVATPSGRTSRGCSMVA